jgi:hypothetical protein
MKFVTHYVQHGLSSGTYDAVAAIRFAFGQDTNRADLRAYQLLRSKTVRRVLDLHFRRDGLEVILSDLQRAARKSVKLGLGVTPATVKALATFEAYITKGVDGEHSDAR